MTGFLSLTAALCVALGVCALAVALLRRLPGQSTWSGNAGGPLPLRLLQRLSTGPRQGVALLQVGSRVLVVSIAEAGTTLLAELDGDARERLLAAVGPATAGPPRGDGLARWWPAAAAIGQASAVRRALGRLRVPLALLALLLCANPARAQHVTSPPPQTGVVSQAPAGSRATSPVTVTPPPLPHVDLSIGTGRDQLRLSGAVGIVVFLGALTLLPAMFLLMTSFTRILVVLHFLRSALGTQTTPPGQLLVAMAVLLTGIVMHPVLDETNRTALQPYFDGRITQSDAYTQGLAPFRDFMLRNVREPDLVMFTELAKVEPPEDESQLPIVVVVAAFVTSELRTAFQMGFALYLPFVVIDVIVSSVLMSLGMFMLPPTMISMPLKLLVFVLADGWTLVVQNLVTSFR